MKISEKIDQAQPFLLIDKKISAVDNLSIVKIYQGERMKFLMTAIFLCFSQFAGSDEGLVRNVTIPGVTGPVVNLENDQVLISLVAKNVSFAGGARISIPKYPNSYIEISPDLESSGTIFAVNIARADFTNRNPGEFTPAKLPGGRAIPGVINGSLPAVAFNLVNFHDVTVYLGPKVLGIFIPANLKIGSTIFTYRHYMGSKRVGNLSVVGPDIKGKNSGVLLLLTTASLVDPNPIY
jgi:hypothetical protein